MMRKEEQCYVEIEVPVTTKIPLRFPINEFEKANIMKNIGDAVTNGKYPICMLDQEKEFLKRNHYFDAFAYTDNTIALLQRNFVESAEEFIALKQIGRPKEFRIVTSQNKQKINTIAQSIEEDDSQAMFLHCPVHIHPDLVNGFAEYCKQKTKNIPFILNNLPHIQLVMPVNTDYYPNKIIQKAQSIIRSYMGLLNGGYDQLRDDAPCKNNHPIDISLSLKQGPREIRYFATSIPSMWWIDAIVEQKEGTIILDPVTMSALQFQKRDSEYVQFLED